MATNVVIFPWNHPIPGRERTSAEHFREFVQYLGGLQQKGVIASFDTVLLDAHGGDLNGFFLLRAEPPKLDTLLASEDWTTHITRAVLHLEGAGVVRGVTGQLVMERMELWSKLLPT